MEQAEKFATEFGVDFESKNNNGKYENQVYFMKRNEEKFVLRIVDKTVRSKENLECELNFVKFLKDEGLKVALPISSSKNEYVIEMDNFLGCLFERVEGLSLKNLLKETDKLSKIFENWGKTMKKIQTISTKFYENNKNSFKRPNFFEKFLDFEQDFKKSSFPSCIESNFFQMKAFLSDLFSKRSSELRLCHSDLHPANFFILQPNLDLILFDFDELCWNFPEADLAIPFFYIQWYGYPNMDLFNEKFFKSGFDSNYDMDLVLKFLQIRELCLYLGMKRIGNDERYSKLLKSIEEDFENSSGFSCENSKFLQLMAVVNKNFLN